MFRAIPDLFQGLAMLFPPWALVILAVVVGLFAVPAWYEYVRAKQIRTRLRWYGRAADDAERERWQTEAFEIAGEKGRRLVTLADEAHKLNQFGLLRKALQILEDTDQCAIDRVRLHENADKEKPRYRHPLEASVAIERLIDQGMFEEAHERLTEALRHFPEDPDLLALSDPTAASAEKHRSPPQRTKG